MTENNHRPDLYESLYKLADENIQAEREDFARLFAEHFRKVTAQLDQEISGLREELADAEHTLDAIREWRQAEFDKVSQVEDLSDDPFQEGWATGVDEAMVALGDVLQDGADQVEVAEELAQPIHPSHGEARGEAL